MSVRHYLLGFDKDGPQLRVEFPIRLDQVEAVKRAIVLYPDDPDAVDPYELAPAQAERIGAIIGRKISGDAYAFFLQAFDESDAIDRARERAVG
jgi:hypothetical protein